jgi:hypothetical protein
MIWIDMTHIKINGNFIASVLNTLLGLENITLKPEDKFGLVFDREQVRYMLGRLIVNVNDQEINNMKLIGYKIRVRS